MTDQSKKLAKEKLEEDTLRLNLMVASLYIFAFELLRHSIVDGVKDEHVMQGEYSKEKMEELKNLDSIMGKMAYDAYLNNITEFKEAVGVDFSTPDNYLLIPCAQWLQKNGALTEEELSIIKRVRKHRNEIAHEMPKFLFNEEDNVDLELFTQVRNILRKIELYWFSIDIHFDPRNWEEIDTSEFPEDEIFSGREVFLELASIAVREYAEEIN